MNRIRGPVSPTQLRMVHGDPRNIIMGEKFAEAHPTAESRHEALSEGIRIMQETAEKMKELCGFDLNGHLVIILRMVKKNGGYTYPLWRAFIDAQQPATNEAELFNLVLRLADSEPYNGNNRNSRNAQGGGNKEILKELKAVKEDVRGLKHTVDQAFAGN